jgi:hypothetical protein
MIEKPMTFVYHILRAVKKTDAENAAAASAGNESNCIA